MKYEKEHEMKHGIEHEIEHEMEHRISIEWSHGGVTFMLFLLATVTEVFCRRSCQERPEKRRIAPWQIWLQKQLFSIAFSINNLPYHNWIHWFQAIALICLAFALLFVTNDSNTIDMVLPKTFRKSLAEGYCLPGEARESLGLACTSVSGLLY